jgi:hypothetical protein
MATMRAWNPQTPPGRWQQTPQRGWQQYAAPRGIGPANYNGYGYQEPPKKTGFWKKLGIGLLKAAPIATAFIPGVGPGLSAAIAGGTSALSKKLEGGTWGQAALAGGIGAGMGYGLGKLRQGFGAKAAGVGGGGRSAGYDPGVITEVGSLGRGGGGGGFAGGGSDYVRQAISDVGRRAVGGGGGGVMPTWGKIALGAGAGLGAYGLGRAMTRGNNDLMPSGPLYEGLPPWQMYDLGGAIARGQQEAIQNQPWRKPSPPNMVQNEETGEWNEQVPLGGYLPPIHPYDVPVNPAMGSMYGPWNYGGTSPTYADFPQQQQRNQYW